MASAVRPAKKSGARKDTTNSSDGRLRSTESRLLQSFASRQEAEQRMIERLARVEHRVIDAMFAEDALQRRDVLGDERAVLGSQIVRNHGHSLARFEIDEVGAVGERKLELAPIEDVKDHHGIALASEIREGIEHRRRLLVKIRDQQHNRPSAKGLTNASCQLREGGWPDPSIVRRRRCRQRWRL